MFYPSHEGCRKVRSLWKKDSRDVLGEASVSNRAGGAVTLGGLHGLKDKALY